MNKKQYENWFKTFCSGYYEQEPEHDSNYKLKEEHTYRVCDNVLRITSSENISGQLSDLAWLCGLFHDLGRFPQYRQYRTFKDSLSVNHGLLSSQIIEDSDILKDFDGAWSKIITEVVRFHNAYKIPSELKDPDTLFCLKVIRDADKIDIWKVFLQYYVSDTKNKPSAVGLGMSEEPHCSEEAIKGIFEKRLLSLSEVRTINDFKILQLSWVFDLNFRESFRMLHERDYLAIYSRSLPLQDDIARMLSFLKSYVLERI